MAEEFTIKAKKKLEEMVAGFGPDFPSIEHLMAMKADEEQFRKMYVPVPDFGRYNNSTVFLEEHMSDRAVWLARWYVMKRYVQHLSYALSNYTGSKRRFIPIMTDDEWATFSRVGISADDIIRAQVLEKFTQHDTAAAGDYLKLYILVFHPELYQFVDAIHFACTSEDPMSIVFGLAANDISFKYALPRIIRFVQRMLKMADDWSGDDMLLLPGLTHQQGAEVTTARIKVTTSMRAIEKVLSGFCYRDSDRWYVHPYSAKWSGGTGNLITFMAAYPEIDWQQFSRNFVERFGLQHDPMPNQSTCFHVEALHFGRFAEILELIDKFVGDFIQLCSCPGQFFVKVPKKGTKPSSLMPNKSNAWGCEGAQRMLRKSGVLLRYAARELKDYPHEGDMGRSYVMRCLGEYFAPIFIALDRIEREMGQYRPNHAKIAAFFHEYPGIAAGSIQTIMKREDVAGDAYRQIQNISVNPDGSYANHDEFTNGLEQRMEALGLPSAVRDDLRWCLEPRNLIVTAEQQAQAEMQQLRDRLDLHVEGLRRQFDLVA